MTGCTTTVERVPWAYPERLEDVVEEILGDASPAWKVSISACANRTAWLLVATPEGRAAFSALLTPGLLSPQHLRTIIAEFYDRNRTDSVCHAN